MIFFCFSFFIDYDAPLSEAGDITSKYLKAREIILEKVLKPQGKVIIILGFLNHWPLRK
jgi:ribosomal protein L16/L10AE